MSHALFAALYAITLLLAAPAAAQQQTNVVFAPGGHTVTLSGVIKGDADHGYLVAARAGQLLTVDFKPTKAPAKHCSWAPQAAITSPPRCQPTDRTVCSFI
jgi:hypothetical protein